MNYSLVFGIWQNHPQGFDISLVAMLWSSNMPGKSLLGGRDWIVFHLRIGLPMVRTKGNCETSVTISQKSTLYGEKSSIWLVVWNISYFPIQLEMSSSQLTNSYFSGVFKPPTSDVICNIWIHPNTWLDSSQFYLVTKST